MKKVLIIDDEGPVRSLITKVLQKARFQCYAADNADAAAKMAATQDFHLVVSDMQMPGRHGHSLVQELLARKKPPLVVVVTGLSEPRLIQDLLIRGVADVFIKPIDADIFVARIRAHLARKEQLLAVGDDDMIDAISGGLSNSTPALMDDPTEDTKTSNSTVSNLERQLDGSQHGYVGAVRLLSSMLGSSQHPSDGHSGRVEEMAGAIGDKYGLDREQVHGVRIAALLHEIGQFGMPDELRLSFANILKDTGKDKFERYPTIGAALISGIPGGITIAEFIESHAENFDGSGFPHRLRGKSIPLGGRIIRVADGVDSFLMSQSCQPHDRLEAVRGFLSQEKGRAFDPILIPFANDILTEQLDREKGRSISDVRVGELVAGKIVAENVYDRSGNFLLRKGSELNDSLIGRLSELLEAEQVVAIVSERPVET